jgi:hypothetical protein
LVFGYIITIAAEKDFSSGALFGTDKYRNCTSRLTFRRSHDPPPVTTGNSIQGHEFLDRNFHIFNSRTVGKTGKAGSGFSKQQKQR